MTGRRIYIRPEPFGCGFDITVEPAPEWGAVASERPTYRSARRCAEAMRTVHPDWRIVDEAGPEA